jgi:hypothetical protein
MSKTKDSESIQDRQKNREIKRPNPRNLTLHVVTPAGGSVEGAEFSLFHAGSDLSCPYKKAVSDCNGYVFFGCIPCGSYIMFQSHMPAGFIKNPHIYNVIVSVNGVFVDGKPGIHTIVNMPGGLIPPKDECEDPHAGPMQPEVEILEMLKAINPDHQLNASNSISINLEFDAKGNPVPKAAGSIEYLIQNEERKAFGIEDSALKRAVEALRGRKPAGAYLRSPAPAGKEACLYKTYGWRETHVYLAVKSIELTGVETSLAVLASEKVRNNTTREINFKASISGSASNTLSQEFSKSQGINVTANVGFNIEFLTGGVSLGYTYNWGESNKKEQTVNFTIASEVETTVQPGKSAIVKMNAAKRKIKCKVVYEAFLNGYVAHHYNSRLDGHYFWADATSNVMKAGSIKNSLTFSDDIDVCFYSEASIDVSDYEEPTVT